MLRKKRITKKLLFAKTVEILQPLLHLDNWRIVVNYSNRMKDVADCVAWPEYKQACIRINMKRLPEFNDYEIIATAIHEMVHCIIWPLTEWTERLCKKDPHKLEITRQHDESVVTTFEKILVDMTSAVLQQRLSEEGYMDLDLSFENLVLKTDKPRKIIKRSTKTKL
jgi:hypothetical protein